MYLKPWVLLICKKYKYKNNEIVKQYYIQLFELIKEKKRNIYYIYIYIYIYINKFLCYKKTIAKGNFYLFYFYFNKNREFIIIILF